MSVGYPWRRRAHVTAVCVIGLLMAAPFYVLIINALKTAPEVVGFPPTWFPHEIRWQNFADALSLLSAQAVVNSVIFTVAVTVLQLILVVTTALPSPRCSSSAGRRCSGCSSSPCSCRSRWC